MDALDPVIAAEVHAHGVVRPPWTRYPDLPAGCIGWRMGAGEAWLSLWGRWLDRQTWPRDQRMAYLQRYPAPKTWDLLAVSALEPELDVDDDDRTITVAEEIEKAGGIGIDVAYAAWKALHGARPPMPWSDGCSVTAAARFDCRPLWFVARWAREQREQASDTPFSVARSPWSWRGFRSALESGRAPSALPWRARTKLAVLIAAEVNPPAPWTLGAPASSMTGAAGEWVSYADAWRSWVLQAIDDAPTYRGYLAKQPPPAEWTDPLAKHVAWFA